MPSDPKHPLRSFLPDGFWMADAEGKQVTLRRARLANKRELLHDCRQRKWLPLDLRINRVSIAAIQGSAGAELVWFSSASDGKLQIT